MIFRKLIVAAAFWVTFFAEEKSNNIHVAAAFFVTFFCCRKKVKARAARAHSKKSHKLFQPSINESVIYA
jgi:hypothetical protein